MRNTGDMDGSGKPSADAARQESESVRVVRVQFGGWDRHLHPECDNSEYLEYERRESGSMISYGYQKRGPGTAYEWIKLSAAQPARSAEQDQPERTLP